ncbi:HAD-superfamily hydrolase, subfamily IA, variant 3 [Thermotoga petrophila RKU-1]|uniref:HAD-superfamily hydrolase, subfamily IA, variant 3 n=1 Tax=Thermotoga petrophila (strain ATCC BAA-488 / DSM 13995 / JCM 10881 / RKU-1) TaxID=390874 RepID=A5IJE4_THEP1|nr:HAD family phosphatase [Thermotoga petrophila]ABQ46317.1 HAD-superfamily hydrolase, subfamily IA, variant 3 [Thermotoga petrophila RKU-1]
MVFEVKNIVFDLGGVLIDWRPCEYLLESFPEEVARVLEKEIFKHEDWKLMDRGVLPENELWEKKKRELPEFKEYVERLEREVPELLRPIEENVRLLPALKKSFKLYALSNYGKIYFEMVRKKYDFFKLFDGMVISSHVGYLKPEKEIYLELIRRYGIAPEESLFIDDTPENVEAARELGFRAVRLEEPSRLKEILTRELNIEL